MFPIKYIDNNLVWNKDNEVFAYYELVPYNYSFLSAEQKFIVHDSFRQLIAQSREGKIHALQIATESSIRSMQEQSKKLVTGKLKEVAYQKIDEQTEALVSMIGDNQVDYRFFLGFKLMVTEEQLNLKNIKKSVWLTFTEFLHEVNHTLMNDFVSMPNDEINRYIKMEKLLENKISRRFKVRRLEIHDFGYLMEHLYGRDGIAYEDYEYQLPKKKLQKETLIKYYDLIRPTRCVIEKTVRLLQLQNRNHMQLLQSQQTDRQKYATECYSAILTSRPRSTATVSLFESKEMKPSVTSKERRLPSGSTTTMVPSLITVNTGSWLGRMPIPPSEAGMVTDFAVPCHTGWSAATMFTCIVNPAITHRIPSACRATSSRDRRCRRYRRMPAPERRRTRRRKCG